MDLEHERYTLYSRPLEASPQLLVELANRTGCIDHVTNEARLLSRLAEGSGRPVICMVTDRLLAEIGLSDRIDAAALPASARSLHRASGRCGELVTGNVAGIDDQLFSDSLFGHRRGAFTGAATNRSFVERVRSGSFRADLYFRLATYHFEIPPLSARPDDIPLLIDHFRRLAADEVTDQLIDEALKRSEGNQSAAGSLRQPSVRNGAIIHGTSVAVACFLR